MAMVNMLADMSIGHWVELGISGVVLVAIGVALWIASKQFQAHNEEITKRNEDISKREEAVMQKSVDASKQIHDMFMKEQEGNKRWMESQQSMMEKWMETQSSAINKMLTVLNESSQRNIPPKRRRRTSNSGSSLKRRWIR